MKSRSGCNKLSPCCKYQCYFDAVRSTEYCRSILHLGDGETGSSRNPRSGFRSFERTSVPQLLPVQGYHWELLEKSRILISTSSQVTVDRYEAARSLNSLLIGYTMYGSHFITSGPSYRHLSRFCKSNEASRALWVPIARLRLYDLSVFRPCPLTPNP